jgi:hypothetical protein
MTRRLAILAILCATHNLVAQQFTITKLEQVGTSINIYYNLVDTIPNRTYSINVFSSRDNFISRLDKVSGDVGLTVKPGQNLKIVWLAREELGRDFDGKIALEIRGRLYIPFIKIEGINSAYKRGVTYPLTWTGGTPQNILNFDLYRGKEKMYSFANKANVGNMEFMFPKTVKPGKDYYFKVTDSKNKDQEVNSEMFRIKPKIPMYVKIGVPVVVAGLVTGVILFFQRIPDPLPPSGG